MKLFLLGLILGAGLTWLLYFLARPRFVRYLQQRRADFQAEQEALAHRQRLETIGAMTSSISHEFNNLLTPIMGYSLLALEKIPGEDPLYDDILEIYTASQKAKELIARLADLSRKNSADFFRELSPDDLVHKTVTVASPVKKDNIQVRLNLNCWDQRILANELQLSQLLLNLILNGFAAMEETGGTLTVRSFFDEEFITYQVSDTGCGIPKEALPQIFDPFFTTKPAGKGTGLGLAIARQIVDDHKGEISVESVPGSTTFTVKLPRNGK